MGDSYDFGPWPRELAYEYIKDVRSFAGYVLLVEGYRLLLRRLQGEARLLDAPDEGAPVEPIERPERFLVRKLGREFLIAAADIESVQASGNYVNLRVRGRENPLRSTIAALEARLDPARFLRVHRSHIVNIDHLAMIEPLDTGDARCTSRTAAPCPAAGATALPFVNAPAPAVRKWLAVKAGVMGPRPTIATCSTRRGGQPRETNRMNTSQHIVRSSATQRIALCLVATAFAIGAASPAVAQRATAKPMPEPQLVSCLLPGQIRAGADNVPTLSARRSVRITAADCQVRGGEYVVAVVARPVIPAAQRRPEDLIIVRCLLPDQIRQLGSKVSYVKVQRPARIARWDCGARGGESVKLARYQQAEKTYLAVVARNKPAPKRP